MVDYYSRTYERAKTMPALHVELEAYNEPWHVRVKLLELSKWKNGFQGQLTTYYEAYMRENTERLLYGEASARRGRNNLPSSLFTRFTALEPRSWHIASPLR